MNGKILTDTSELKSALTQARSIAVVGLSPKSERDSHRVSVFLQQKGYRIIPIRPGQKEILGEKAFGSLDDIDQPVDIVVAFRRSDMILPHAREALRIKPRLFWMQLGIENAEAAALAEARGVTVIQNRCPKIDYPRLFG